MQKICMLQFADDTALLELSLCKEELENALGEMKEILTESYNMKINKKMRVLVGIRKECKNIG